MSTKWKLICLVSGGLFITSPAMAVDLVGVHDLASKSDPRLQAAEFRRDATGENRKIARANLLPQINAGGNWSWGETSTKIAGQDLPDQDTETTIYEASLVQSLYRQANYESLDIARGQITQADAIYEIAYQDFLLRVSETYFLTLTLIDGVTFAEAEEKAFQRQFEQAEQRFEVGLTAVTDVHEARASYDNARARAIVARNDLADAKEAIRQLTGEYFEEYDTLQEVLPLVEPDPVNADNWVAMALQSNPAVLSARSGVDVADANMRLARSGYFPTLDLLGTVNRFENDKYRFFDPIEGGILNSTLRSDDSNIRLVLNVPIYQGGRVNAQTRQARLLLDATGQDLDDVQRTVIREAQNSYRAVLAGIQEVQAFEQASISAESALEATQAGFEVGTRTIVDVLIAEQRKYQAQRDNSVARHAYIIRHLRLKSVAGLLNSDDLSVVNQLLE
ncbi:MAG: TolC family outer membrane protein [Gammaproteobacteria bacterium]|nr:TolC family outer membrane protein [Gammaproteobacteria bacterium]